MSDVHNKTTRSYNMSRIKGKNTEPELLVRKYLFSKGLRFRLHDNKLPGKPDIVLQKYKSIVQVNGCFWHSHIGCKDFKIPKTRTEWWKKKLNATKKRDNKNNNELEKSGWHIFTIWECELKDNLREITLVNLYKDIICPN